MRWLLLLWFPFASAALAQEATDDLPALVEAGNASYLRGDYDAARDALLKAWDLAQQTPADDPVRYEILKRLTSARAAAGEFADADNYLQQAITGRENRYGRNDPKVADDFLVGVGLCRGMKNYGRAHAILSRVMGLHAIAFGPQSTALADDYSRMAQLYLDEKDMTSPAGSLNTALEIRSKVSGPLDLSLVLDLDRLAATYITLRDYGKAEETYTRALVIRETLYGREDPDLIATVDGLAYARFGQKKYAEAEPVYQRLIALWIKSVGPEHPMVAMAFDKVAMFYADQKKYDQAKEAQDRSVAIRAHFLASGLSVAATEQVVEKNMEAAMAMYQRALAVLDPPSQVYEQLKGEIGKVVEALEPSPPKAPAKKAVPKRK
jgi:tetratricopeptide (TPR) repeat protein